MQLRANTDSITVAAVLLLLLTASQAQADLSLTLTPGTRLGAGKNEVTFTGVLSNAISSSPVFLNDVQFNFFDAAGNSLTADTNAFFANVPGILLAGESYRDAFFGVALDPATPAGDYFGSITVLGGADIFATNALVTRTFHISWTDSVGDGIPDWWRQEYFGGSGTSTNDQSCAACDADGTGQDNLFKYTAGLTPTNAASVFVLSIAMPAQPSLILGPVATGRSYAGQFSSDLSAGLWSPLTSYSSVPTNGNRLVIIDLNPASTQRFYRIQIKLP